MKLYSHSSGEFLFDPHYGLFKVSTPEDFLGLLLLLNSNYIPLWNVIYILTCFLSCSVNHRGWRVRLWLWCRLLCFCFSCVSSASCILETLKSHYGAHTHIWLWSPDWTGPLLLCNVTYLSLVMLLVLTSPLSSIYISMLDFLCLAFADPFSEARSLYLAQDYLGS